MGWESVSLTKRTPAVTTAQRIGNSLAAVFADVVSRHGNLTCVFSRQRITVTVAYVYLSCQFPPPFDGVRTSHRASLILMDRGVRNQLVRLPTNNVASRVDVIGHRHKPTVSLFVAVELDS